MKVRGFRPFDCAPECCIFHAHGASDIQRLQELYAEQGFEYNQPAWEKLFGLVLEDESGIVRDFLLHRPTVESYAVADRSAWATPGVKAEYFELLDRASQRLLRQAGYTDQHSWIPPVCRAFLRRLKKSFGWVDAEGLEKWHGLVREL